MHSPNQNKIIDYGIAYAYDFYTLSELVKLQIKKGFQPFNGLFIAAGIDGEQYCQALVKYASNKITIGVAIKKKQPISKNIKAKTK